MRLKIIRCKVGLKTLTWHKFYHLGQSHDVREQDGKWWISLKERKRKMSKRWGPLGPPGSAASLSSNAVAFVIFSPLFAQGFMLLLWQNKLTVLSPQRIITVHCWVLLDSQYLQCSFLVLPLCWLLAEEIYTYFAVNTFRSM